jgi:hypothetical protein
VLLARFHYACSDAVNLLKRSETGATGNKRTYEGVLDRLGREVPHVRLKNGKPIDPEAALAANHTIDCLEYALKCISIPAETNDNAYEACDHAYRAVDVLGDEDAKREMQARIERSLQGRQKSR